MEASVSDLGVGYLDSGTRKEMTVPTSFLVYNILNLFCLMVGGPVVVL